MKIQLTLIDDETKYENLDEPIIEEVCLGSITKEKACFLFSHVVESFLTMKDKLDASETQEVSKGVH